MGLIQVGQTAPALELLASNGKMINLSAYKGHKNVVLIFYPKDNTPGWIRQLSAARDAASEYDAKDTVVFGVNPGRLASHQKFEEKYGFSFPLLVDSERTAAADFGALKEDGLGIARTVFVINKEGQVIFVAQGTPESSEILAAITWSLIRKWEGSPSLLIFHVRAKLSKL